MAGEKRVTPAGIATGAVIAIAVVAGVLAVVFTDTTGERGSGLGEEYTYDYSEHREVDPKLLGYAETGRVATGFRAARGIAVGPGGPGGEELVYVAGDRAVRVFRLDKLGEPDSSDGERLAEVVLEDEPRCVAVGAGGLLYIGMKDHVEVYASPTAGRGERKAEWAGFGPKALVTSVAVSGEHVFVADAGNKVVHRCDRSGNVTARIGEKDEARGVPGFAIYKPCLDLLVAPGAADTAGGKLVVVNPGRFRIETYTVEGDLVSSWGEGSIRIEGFAGSCNPANIAMLPDGRIVTAEKGGMFRRVKVYEVRGGRGRLASVVAGPKQFEDAPFPLDVAADSKGRVLVLDTAAGAVRIFEER